MYINPYLENRLADHRIKEALSVAKTDYLLRGGKFLSRRKRMALPIGLFLLPLMAIRATFELGLQLVRRHSSDPSKGTP